MASYPRKSITPGQPTSLLGVGLTHVSSSNDFLRSCAQVPILPLPHECDANAFPNWPSGKLLGRIPQENNVTPAVRSKFLHSDLAQEPGWIMKPGHRSYDREEKWRNRHASESFMAGTIAEGQQPTLMSVLESSSEDELHAGAPVTESFLEEHVRAGVAGVRPPTPYVSAANGQDAAVTPDSTPNMQSRFSSWGTSSDEEEEEEDGGVTVSDPFSDFDHVTDLAAQKQHSDVSPKPNKVPTPRCNPSPGEMRRRRLTMVPGQFAMNAPFPAAREWSNVPVEGETNQPNRNPSPRELRRRRVTLMLPGDPVGAWPPITWEAPASPSRRISLQAETIVVEEVSDEEEEQDEEESITSDGVGTVLSPDIVASRVRQYHADMARYTAWITDGVRRGMSPVPESISEFIQAVQRAMKPTPEHESADDRPVERAQGLRGRFRDWRRRHFVRRRLEYFGWPFEEGMSV